jgi:hypothetical protein
MPAQAPFARRFGLFGSTTLLFTPFHYWHLRATAQPPSRLQFAQQLWLTTNGGATSRSNMGGWRTELSSAEMGLPGCTAFWNSPSR